MSPINRSHQNLQSILEGTASATGEDFFVSLAKAITRTFRVRYSMITQCSHDDPTHIRTLAYVEHDRLLNAVEYDSSGNPCDFVLKGNNYYQPEDLQKHYPGQSGIEAYIGVPVYDSGGEVIGHIAALHDKPIDCTEEDIHILNIFATRVGAEIERKRAEENLHKALHEVERLKNRLEAEIGYLQQEIKLEHNFEEIISRSEAFKQVLSKVEQVAATDATALILGETGTGKELLARAIHNISPRRLRPLVKVNCAVLPANLIESELFGHEKGAFTGAVSKKTGRFELADGGTIFLDEIGDLPLELQTKLLRILQEGEFERLGGNRTIKVDVRIIAATNIKLEEAVKNGRFRSDLYYRLNVFPIHVIPLREHKEDIPLLVNHFTRKFSKKIGKKVERVAQKTLNAMMDYAWPGNVRELENVVERSVILSKGDELEVGDWWPGESMAALPEIEKPPSTDEILTLRELEKRHILQVLKKTKWRVGGDRGAARLLDIKPTTLEARMKKLGIRRGFS